MTGADINKEAANCLLLPGRSTITEFLAWGGQDLDIDLLGQLSIGRAKAVTSGQGVGSAVTSVLIEKLRTGEFTSADQLPHDVHHIGRALLRR